MSEPSPQRASFQVPPERALIHRRAVFSKATARIGSHFVEEDETARPAPGRKRQLQDESLRLIDDLTNRPMDPLFEDARLTPRPSRSSLALWVNRVVVFLICAAVGLGVASVVQVLHRDPRQKVREKLISQIQDVSQRSDNLSGQIDGLRGQIDQLSAKVGAGGAAGNGSASDILNGSVAVHGPGVTMTLSNPLSSKDNDKGDQTKVVTDSDLQWFTTQLWSAGAEAIAINGHRIGAQTSIRLAGQTVLIGTDSVQSPYRIEAIGDSRALKSHFDEGDQRDYLSKLRAANITLQVSSARDITLKGAGVPDLQYARKGR
ncbi:hypothetical protein BACT_0682 [Bifidobacterium actinocoloniiforme DSM 22766]|uniref:Membrane associated protein n=1 Tax=Bifidobacterium actinocoloniiforme DSM 22766 TaxID=1437605 RepID=A0A086Z0D1_9BIFI|nr:DUF881 domain-containing protein [Bifidobacterium actinocoloniiforme]AKV55226.1 hypothetical protein AB656_02030 [Bifidobacterium actinocoloniiforme DSM 22766]KFI39981.1 hypothetical protein BACT_0682 [Bifidobacterium actinocoloniiforme DSM 22766]